MKVLTHNGEFQLGDGAFDYDVPGDTNLACGLFEATCAHLCDEWTFRTFPYGGRERDHDSLSDLRKSRAKWQIIEFLTAFGDAEFRLSLSGKTVRVNIQGGDASHDDLFTDTMDAVAPLVDLGSMFLAVGEGNAGPGSAGFHQSLGPGATYWTHSPVMYFTPAVFNQLGDDALATVARVGELAGPSGRVVKRVQVGDVREYPIEARDVAFDLIAPVRTARMIAKPIDHGSIVWGRYSSIEAVLVVPSVHYDVSKVEYPSWHPDRGVLVHERTLADWEASFDDHLRLTPEVIERAKSFVFPTEEKWRSNGHSGNSNGVEGFHRSDRER